PGDGVKAVHDAGVQHVKGEGGAPGSGRTFEPSPPVQAGSPSPPKYPEKDTAAQERGEKEDSHRWGKQGLPSDVLHDHIADNEHGACVVAKRQKIGGLLPAYLPLPQKVSRHLGAHGISAEKSRNDRKCPAV